MGGKRNLLHVLHRLGREDGEAHDGHVKGPRPLEEARACLRQGLRGKYVNRCTKSGSVVCRLVGGASVAVKIDGKYWIYWGEWQVHATFKDR